VHSADHLCGGNSGLAWLYRWSWLRLQCIFLDRFRKDLRYGRIRRGKFSWRCADRCPDWLSSHHLLLQQGSQARVNEPVEQWPNVSRSPYLLVAALFFFVTGHDQSLTCRLGGYVICLHGFCQGVFVVSCRLNFAVTADNIYQSTQTNLSSASRSPGFRFTRMEEIEVPCLVLAFVGIHRVKNTKQVVKGVR